MGFLYDFNSRKNEKKNKAKTETQNLLYSIGLFQLIIVFSLNLPIV